MIAVHDDLLTVLDAVHIESRASYRIVANNQPDLAPFDRHVSTNDSTRLVEALADDIYRLLYCRPEQADVQAPYDEGTRRNHLSSLVAANTGRGSWDAGWTVRQIEPGGAVGVAKGAVTFWASPTQVLSSNGPLVVGGECRVWVPSELRSLVPGFYLVRGEAYYEGQPNEIGADPRVRLYWHLTPRAAAPLVAATVTLFNERRIPFELKVLSEPRAYTRADAGVLYLRPSQDERVGATLREIYSAVTFELRDSVPLFTRRVAVGLGCAEFPDGPISFGQDRCRLAAEAIWASFEHGETDREDRARRLASSFLNRGLDPANPDRDRQSSPNLPFGLPRDEAAFCAAPQSSRPGWSRASEVARDIRLPSFFLDGARQIGDTLCRAAYWDGNGRLCNWLGRSAEAATTRGNKPLKPTVTALEPDLYAGSAGVALFLARLFAITGDPEQRRTAVGAMARSIRQLGQPARGELVSPLSLFFGDLGVLYVARIVARLTEERSLVTEVNVLRERIGAAAEEPHSLDVMSGNAGAIPVLLEMSRDVGSEHDLDLATSLGSELCATAIHEGNTCRWDPVRASGFGNMTRSLAGFSHGAAGMGLALLELYAVTGRPDFLDTARGAFAFEDSLFDPQKRNWPDRRNASTPDLYSSAWCHGAPGIALCRLRAASLDPERAVEYLATARIALATTLDTIEKDLAAPVGDATLCHGLAGLGEITFIAGRELKDDALRNRAFTLAEVLIERYGPSGDWPSGVPSRGPNPSLMLGVAGVGYWFLRLYEPERTPSVLVCWPELS